jgi:hypothetical protein
MAKKNKALLAVGLVAAGVGIYLLTRKPSTTTTTTPTPLPAGSNPAISSGSTLSTLLTAGLSAVKSIFGGSSSTYAPLAPISVAPTTTPYASPAAGINYINPSAPDILSPSLGDFTAGDTYDSGGIVPTEDIFV